jgi:hypothetical protein
MMGVELPGAGRGVFQATFSDGLNRVGSWDSLLTPMPRAPRHAGQFSATATLVKTQIATTSVQDIRLIRKVSTWLDVTSGKSAVIA